MSIIDDIIEKLYIKIKEYNWNIILRTFMFSNEFRNIIISLSELISDGRRFTPPLKDIFLSFNYCNPTKIKTVIIIDNPLKDVNLNKGYAFLLSDNIHKFHFLKAIKNSNINVEEDNEDSVLILYNSFTTDLERHTDKHFNIWKPFFNYLLDVISKDKDVVFLFIGKKSLSYKNVIKSNKYVAVEEFPNNRKLWEYNDCFNIINNHLKEPINWNTYLKYK
ncbi:MAG: hypothetical protein EOL97_08560 [Spirochaetia bacterium]|nr:hypothetical protein [Spirochaetia bacterium]